MTTDRRHIVFDTETTGLDPASGHRLVEIGCVEVVDYLPTGRNFHYYVNPERDMPAEAEKVHGISADFLRDKPLFKHIARPFLQFIGTSPLVAHNASFDMKFINAELLAAGFNTIDPARAIDTVAIARKRYPGQPANLDALCRRFYIDLSARTKHGALLDAELLAEVYLELMGGRQSSFGLKTDTHPATQTQAGQGSPSASGQTHQFPRRHFNPSDEERARHQAFIAEHIKQPVWAKYSSG